MALTTYAMHARTSQTLIELLVVIATMTVLLAILLPSLNAARNMAKRVECCNNLKQIATAWMLYLEAHDDYFYRETGANIEYGGWCASPGRQGPRPRPLNPYMDLELRPLENEKARVFCCPSDFGGINQANISKPAFEDYGTSYQTNLYLVGPPMLATTSAATQGLHEELNKRIVGSKNAAGFRRADVDVNHAQVALTGDYPWWNQTRRRTKLDANWHKKENHYNISFLDGHVKFQEIITPCFIKDDFAIVPFKDKNLRELARTAEETIRQSLQE